MIKVFGIKNCDTMKKAMNWLADNGIAYEFIDYKKAGVAAAGLLQLAADQRGDGGGFAEQLGDRRLVVAAGLHLLPGLVETDDGAADIEALEQEATNEAAAHFSFSA